MSVTLCISSIRHAVFLCLILLSHTVLTAAPLRIAIDASDDALLLPFAGEVLREQPLFDRVAHAYRPVHVLWSTDSATGLAGLLFGYNQTAGSGDPSMLLVTHWPGSAILDEQPVRLRLSDLVALPVPDSMPLTAIGTGVRNDTGFFFFYQPEQEYYREHFLVAGVDRNGDGRWVGSLPITKLFDFDGDGIAQPLIFVASGRDGAPRELMRVNPISGEVLWRVSISSQMQTHRGLFVRAQEPRLTLVTASPAQGFSDSLFADTYSYFVAITSDGRVVTHTIVSRYPGPTVLTYDEAVDEHYLYHTMPPTEETSVADTAVAVPRLSKIAADGAILNTIAAPEQLNALWLHDYERGGARELYTLSSTGTIRIFDSSLLLLAESESTTLGGYIGYGPSLPGYPVTFAFRDTRAFTTLFSESFQQLVILPDLNQFDIIDARHAQDSILLVTAMPSNNIKIVRLRPRPTFEYLAILFNRYRNYIMAVLFGLLVGLVVVNYYRVKTRHNLNTISDQKAEIERTHKALQEAQQQIIEAEKYRQAQDIAGGFAHEIRNALLPAQIAHQKLKQVVPEATPSVERAEHGVQRALDLIDLVAQYTRLDSTHHARSVQLGMVVEAALDDLRARIEEHGIEVSSRGDQTLRVHADPEHLRMLLSNLLANACDALAESAVRRITISLVREAEYIALSVADTGSGIEPSILPRMFNPFVSSKPREGHGLGLSLVSRIVSVYGGEVRAANQESGGAIVTVLLPPGPSTDGHSERSA